MVKLSNTLDYCLPYPNYEFAAEAVVQEHKRTLPIRDRPMSWLLFIPVLIFLRIFRFVISIFCILFGNGEEFTALQMKNKISNFRRYYRSIRHYAVKKYSDNDLDLIAKRKEFFRWRVYYRIYGMFFLTSPADENNNDNEV
jgi:hypothetical protein